jgi:hypothetical protein
MATIVYFVSGMNAERADSEVCPYKIHVELNDYPE